MIKAVIFDFDGIIGDTMLDNCLAWQYAFAANNVKIEPIDYYLLEGMGRHQIARFFIDKLNLQADIEQNIVDLKETHYKLNNQFSVFPEIPEIFALLESYQIKIAIVTGASKQRLRETLNFNLRDKASAIITADDVINSKPDPEPYIKAIEKLGIPAEKCLVIENAMLGIESAKKANCRCFAVQTTLDHTYLQKADEVFTTHFDLLAKLKQTFSAQHLAAN